MTREEFLAALDRYGGNLRSWPSSLRGDAEALVVRDAVVAAALDRQARLDAHLAEALAPGPADAALIGRIIARRQVLQEADLQPTRRAIGWVSAALAAMLLIGFVAGT